MENIMMLLLGSVGLVALVSVFNDSDDDNHTDDSNTATEGDDQLTNEPNQTGVIDELGGNDALTLTGPDDPARAVDQDGPVIWYPPNGAPTPPYDWQPGTPLPEDGLSGLLVGRGGEGDDTINATGNGLDLSGDAGNDQITVDRDDTPSDGNIVVRGGEGDDTLRVTGRGGFVFGDEGNDALHVTGEGYTVDGGAGADRVDVTGMTNSGITLDRGDTLLGRGQGHDGLSFHLGDGMDFTGNSGADHLILDPGARANGGAGDDYLRTNDYLTDARLTDAGVGSTLMGGTGNDTLIGNYGLAHAASGGTAQDQFAWHVGKTNDVLDGGNGNDHLGFDLSDTVTGGTGNDVFEGFVQRGETAVVTDFQQGRDWMRINCDPREVGSNTEGSGDNHDYLGVEEKDGATTISLGGESVLRIEGATGLKIGFEVSRFEGDTDTHYTDQNGDPVPREDLDVVINPYQRFVA